MVVGEKDGAYNAWIRYGGRVSGDVDGGMRRVKEARFLHLMVVFQIWSK